MKVITLWDFRNNLAAVMDAVVAGDTFRITRNGGEVAEVRPVDLEHRFTAAELVARHRRLPRVGYAEMLWESDDFFGTEDRPIPRG